MFLYEYESAQIQADSVKHVGGDWLERSAAGPRCHEFPLWGSQQITFAGSAAASGLGQRIIRAVGS